MEKILPVNIGDVVGRILSADDVSAAVSEELSNTLETLKKYNYPVSNRSVVQSIWGSLTARINDMRQILGEQLYGIGKMSWSKEHGYHGLSEKESLALNKMVMELTDKEHQALDSIMRYPLPREYPSYIT